MSTSPPSEKSPISEGSSDSNALEPAEPDLPSWFREIDHTGDVAIEVSAPTRAELFERAAWGLFYVLTEMVAVEPRGEQKLVVEGRDPEDLLVKWMSDLNYLHITQDWLFCRFEVEDVTDEKLTARAYGEHYDPDRHVIYTEVKAITYHDMSITHDDDGWNVQVVFDM